MFGSCEKPVGWNHLLLPQVLQGHNERPESLRVVWPGLRVRTRLLRWVLCWHQKWSSALRGLFWGVPWGKCVLIFNVWLWWIINGKLNLICNNIIVFQELFFIIIICLIFRLLFDMICHYYYIYNIFRNSNLCSNIYMYKFVVTILATPNCIEISKSHSLCLKGVP